MWAATRHQVLKGYKTEYLRKSLAFSLLAAYHTYVFFAAALSILTLSGNLILAWFISWFQEVRNSNAGTNAREVSLGFYLAVLTRSWLVIQLSAELVRCSLWLVEDAWQLQTFRTYRQVLTGYAPGLMLDSDQAITAAQHMASRDWLHSGSKRWWLDLAVQVLLYGTLDVIPLVLCIAPLTKLDLSTALSTLFASACSIAVFHCILLYGAWIVSDIVAKFYSWKSIRRPADVPHEVQVDEVDVEQTADADAPGEAADAADADEDEHTEEDPMKPAHVCALLGGALHLGWVTVLKLVVFVGLLVLAVQRDVLSENPFWLLAALFVGVAFWQRTLATGWYFLAKCLLLRCRCCRCIWEAPIHGGPDQLQALRHFATDLQRWGEKNAGMAWPILAQRYDLVIFVLLLQIALFGNFRWSGGALFLLLLVVVLLLRRSTLVGLDRWRSFFSLLETLGFLLFAAVLNAAYSPAAGLGVLVMAIVLQCFMARTELRAYRTMRAVTLGLHCSLVVIVAICMWSMEGGSHWSGHRKAPAENAIGGSVEEYPFCHLKWPLGKEGKQEMSLIDFADMCALTNLPSSDFNSSLESRFPGWSLLYERRGGESHSYGYNDWTTFFELADPSNETTIFAVRGTQSPLDVMQDLNIFTPVAVTQIAAYFGPDLTSSVTKTVFALFSGLPTIDKDFFQVLLEHVKNRVKGSPDRRFYLTGHSLGGGLAKLVALEVGQKSVTFAAPGLRYTSQMLLSDTAFSKDQLLASGDRLGTVVVPEHDLVSRVDQQLGAQLGIACDKNLCLERSIRSFQKLQGNGRKDSTSWSRPGHSRPQKPCRFCW